MRLSKLALSLTESELNTMLQTALARMADTPEGEKLSKIKNPEVVLSGDVLCFRCKATMMGVIPVPVEAQIHLAPARDGSAIALTLKKVSMAMFGGEMAAGPLMQQLAGYIGDKPGLSVEWATLTIALDVISRSRGIDLTGRLNTLGVAQGALELDFS